MEDKEIDECVKELNGLYDKLHERFCEGTFCTGCVLDKPQRIRREVATLGC